MNLFEILIVLLFIVFPLLQQVLGQRKEPGGPEEGIEEGDEERAAGHLPTPRRRPESDRAEAPGGWSADWGEWPGAHDDGEAAAEIAAEHLPEEAADVEVRRAGPPESYDLPETVRASTKVVSLEELHVDRAGEHARFHARPDQRLPEPERRPSRLAGLVARRGDLRTAIILSEVVQPPVGLRDLPGWHRVR